MAYNTEEEKKLATTVDEQLSQKPADFAWDKQQLLDDTTDKWLNREDFQYDYTNDPLYQQYKEQYTNLGKLAMQDTMGQAAALTGGYGNSYAQTAGQQAYQGYLQQLNNVMPELYGAAYDRYMAEGQALYDQIALLEGQRSQAYGEHQDQYSQWQNYLNFLYQQKRDAVADSQWQQEYNLSAAKAYTGDNATEDEDYTGVAVPGGGSLSSENIRMIQWSLGIEPTGVWDQQTVDKSGYKNSNDCYEDWINGKVVNGKEWTTYYMPQMQEGNKIMADIKGKSDEEKEAAIRSAYEAGRIDSTMAQELLWQNGLA